MRGPLRLRVGIVNNRFVDVVQLVVDRRDQGMNHGGLPRPGDDHRTARVVFQVSLDAASSGSLRFLWRIDTGYAQRGGQFPRNVLNLACPTRRTMIGARARDRVQRLDHVQPVHLLLLVFVVQPAAGGEIAGVLDRQRRAVAEQVGVKAHNHLGIFQFD